MPCWWWRFVLGGRSKGKGGREEGDEVKEGPAGAQAFAAAQFPPEAFERSGGFETVMAGGEEGEALVEGLLAPVARFAAGQFVRLLGQRRGLSVATALQ